MMEFVCKAAGLAAVAAALAMLLKKDSPVFAFAVSLAGGAVILVAAMGVFGQTVSQLSDMGQKAGIGAAEAGVMFKVLGISLVSRFAAQICQEAGQGAASMAVQLCGTVAIICSAMPMFIGIMDLLGGLL